MISSDKIVLVNLHVLCAFLHWARPPGFERADKERRADEDLLSVNFMSVGVL